MKKKKYNIKGMKWTINKIPNTMYIKLYGNDSHGMCDKDRQIIAIRRTSFDIETVTHEVVHAYMHSCMISAADLDAAQTEEVLCEIFSHHGAEIIALSCKIMSDLK